MMSYFARAVPDRPFARYAIAVAAVAASFVVRYGLVQGLGLDMPPFITYFPAIMVVAVLAGFWPGILATALVVLAVDYAILPPVGQFSIVKTSDIFALSFFALMGILIALLAEGYRRSLLSIAAYKEEQALRQSEDQLRQASEYQRLAMDAAGLGAWEIHLDPAHIDGNECWRRILGFQPGEHIDFTTASHSLHPEDRAMVEEAYRCAAASEDGVLNLSEHRFLRPDGSIHWAITRGRAFFIGQGAERHVNKMIGVTVDVTERKQAEEARAAERAKLDVALASMTDAVFISDAKGQFIQFNDAFATFHKFANKRTCARMLAEYPEFLEVSMADGQLAPLEMWAVPRALRGETAANEEYRLRRKDTGETWIGSYSFAPVRDHEGTIIGSVVVGRDITEQKRAEEALRKSEALYHGLFDSMDEGFCIIEMIFDAEGEPTDYRFLEINAAFERQTGLHEATGKRMRELAPSHEEFWFEIYGKIALSGEPAQFTHEAKALNAYYEVSAYRVGELELRQVAIVFRDISERTRAEAHIRQLNRVYTVLSDINQTIVREKDSQAMLEAACRIAVDAGKFRMAWVGMIDAATHTLEPIAWSGIVDGYLDLVKINSVNSNPAVGPVAKCFHSGKHAVCNDIEHELYRPWRSDALRHGYRSLASFPLRCEGRIVGVFNLYASELAFFDDDEIKLLDELAMDVSFALEVNRHEEARKRAEEHIQQLNRVYSVLSDINQTIVREKDSQAMLEAACRIAVDKGKFRMAWVGMVDPETQVLSAVASNGFIEGYLDVAQIDLRDPTRPNRLPADAFYSGISAICNDIEHDQRYLSWRDEAMHCGYRAAGSFPLKVDGQAVGVFTLYASVPDFFEGDELSLLNEMAMDISHALEVDRHEKNRQKAEEELRWRTAFFEAQVDSSLDGVLVVDSTGKKILQNRRMKEMLDIPANIADDPDDAQQLQFAKRFVKNPAQFIEKVEYLISHPEEVSWDEVELLNGTILDRCSSPVRDKSNTYYGRIWTFRDITERRQLEEQFRQSQKMEAVGQLTGGIAHDFNNLLTVILGCSEFIGEEVKENPRLHKMAQMILDAAQRGADLTHRMLAFARRQTLQPRAVDVNRMLANMMNFLRRTLSADIDLQVVQSAGDCTALVDLVQLESALLNLCVNARDAMPRGGTLIIETGLSTLDVDYASQNPDVTPGRYILIAVSDTGCGIIRENLTRVFDPFFTTKEVGKGTGLGLSMVYGFVKQSKGHIRIYSEPKQGTSVKLYLPVADQGSEPSNQGSSLSVDLRGSEVILLVEDNVPVREFAKSQLLYLGYKVLDAANGTEALSVLKEHGEIDLLFTDVVMPGGLNGRELAQEAQRLYPALKVLFCSGYTESASFHMGMLAKGIQLLNKPYSRLDLARAIREVVSGSESAAEWEGHGA
jgi:PAS domain S-box-containing protein